MKRTVAATACAALLLTAGVGPVEAAPGPAPDLQTIDLDAATARSAGATASVPGRRTRPFSLVGATWADPAARLAGRVEVRTRTAGRWTGWQALESDVPNAADPGAEDGPVRGSTDPLWVGESDGVEARVVTAAGRRTNLPPGLRLDLINPHGKR